MKKKLLSIATAAAVLFLAGLCRAEEMVQIKGSDTLINMVQKLAEVYMDKNPGAQIAVTGGGSGTGFAALSNKTCDIANASRGIKSSEVDACAKKSVDPKRIVVAIDALSIVVSKDNPVGELTVEQIGKIYRGETKNWSEVGGQDMPIALYGRQSNSGTYDFMKENVMFGEYPSSLKSMNGNAQIAEALKQDRSGIGYIGVGYAKEAAGIKVIKVAAKAGGKYYDPFNMMDVKSGRYPITRPLNQYINGTPKGMVKKFLTFEISPEGQAIVEEQGFFAIPDEYQNYNAQTLGTTGIIRDGSMMRPADLDTNDSAG